jgi:hypothetical protein
LIPITRMFHDPTRRLVVYDSTQAGEILCSIASARGINGSMVAVPTDLYSLQLAAHLGLPVPPIIGEDYDWPHGPDIPGPLAHQKVTANFCAVNPRCFNLSDMGTMKTLSTLWGADFLMRQYEDDGEPFRALVVAPLSTLQLVWGDALFHHFMGRRTFRILDGSASRRERLLSEPADFYIINFDGACIGSSRGKLGGLSAAIAARSDIKLVIIDEASAYKDPRTRRHRIARKLFDRPYLWLLTGTPTAQGHLGAFGLAKLVNNAFDESYGSWVGRTTIPISKFKRVPTPEAHLEARKLLSPAIRYDIRDVWDGPPLTTQFRTVELTTEQKQHLHALKSDLVLAMKDGTLIVPANEAVARTKYLQICMGAIYDKHHNTHLIDSSSRIGELEDIISQAPAKVIILSPLTNVIHLLYKKLETKWTCAIINGETSRQDRDSIVHAFQGDHDPHVIIADPRCLKFGLTLHAARTLVWYGATDSNETYEQANKRAHRPGQKHPVTNVQIVSTPLEREIYRRLAANERLQGVLLDMVRRELL